MFLKDFVEEKIYGIARNGNGINNFSMDEIMSEAIVKNGKCRNLWTGRDAMGLTAPAEREGMSRCLISRYERGNIK